MSIKYLTQEDIDSVLWKTIHIAIFYIYLTENVINLILIFEGQFSALLQLFPDAAFIHHADFTGFIHSQSVGMMH